MALEAVTSSWQTVTLAADEFWQARGNTVRVTKSSSLPGNDDGLSLSDVLGWQFSTGDQIYYRCTSGTGLIWREVTS